MIRATRRQSDLVRNGLPWRTGALITALLITAQGVQAVPEVQGVQGPQAAAGQGATRDSQAVARAIEQRFDVLPLREGVALRPRSRRPAGARSIEVVRGEIAIDGVPVTGRELRDRLGDEIAENVLRLSYLNVDQQRALFGLSSSVSGAPGASNPSGAASAPAREPETPSDATRPPQENAVPEAGIEPGSRGEMRRERRRVPQNGRQSDRVRFGGSVAVDPGEVVAGDIVAIGGSVTVRGEVHGDAVAIGGDLDLGPEAIVHGDAVAIGGALRRSPGARVDGDVKEIAWGMTPFDGHGPSMWFGPWLRQSIAAPLALASTLTRAAVLALFGALVILIGRTYVDRVSSRAASEPWKAGAIGLLAQLLFFPLLIVTVVVLVITVIGIPLILVIPLVMLGLLFVAIVGFTAVAQRLGSRASTALGLGASSPYLTMVLGLLVVLSPLVAARLFGVVGVPQMLTSSLVLVGFVLEYAAWTVGFGAVALERFQRRPPPAVQPSMPVAPPAESGGSTAEG